jgi:hypothetical protein
MNFDIYFLLTCGLPIWLGFFSYKDVAAGFENFLVLQGYLMGNNIVRMAKLGVVSCMKVVAKCFSFPYR